tara:strand:- start:1928 stop:2857 length:930 start_codon:yes stop_codon:yes gene_type:complete
MARTKEGEAAYTSRSGRKWILFKDNKDVRKRIWHLVDGQGKVIRKQTGAINIGGNIAEATRRSESAFRSAAQTTSGRGAGRSAFSTRPQKDRQVKNIQWPGSKLIKAISSSRQTMENLDAIRNRRDNFSPDSSPGGDSDQDRIIDMKSPVVQNAIKEQEKLKIAQSRWASNLVGYMDAGGNYIGGPGTIKEGTTTSETEDQTRQNAGISTKSESTEVAPLSTNVFTRHYKTGETLGVLTNAQRKAYEKEAAGRTYESEVAKHHQKTKSPSHLKETKYKSSLRNKIASLRKDDKDKTNASVFAPQTKTKV